MAQEMLPSQVELLERMEQGWQDFTTFLDGLTTEQMTVPTDAAGWTVKDHIMHLAVWEDGIYALLEGESRHERMGLDAETWRRPGYDRMNAVIQQRYRDVPLDDVLSNFNQVHQRLVAKIRTMTDEELMRPYRSYEPGSNQENPILFYIVGNSFGHYEEHRPWIEAIAAKA